MDKLFFNGEFTYKGNFRGEDVYQFLDDLKAKMEIKEVSDVARMEFLNHHLSVTVKTMVKCVTDFDEASSKLIKVYGNSWAIIRRALMEADDEITPVWRRVQARNARIKPNRSAPLVNVGDNILVFETLLLLFKRLKRMSERDDKFKVSIFNSQVIEPILGLVPKEVRFRFIRECVDNKFKEHG